MTTEIPYTEGEKVLCYHGPLLYEAKCLKHRISEENKNEYMIHYQGWNKNWDEWVPDTRILKYNDANLAKQKELIESHKDGRKKSKNKKSITVKEAKPSDVKSEGSANDPDSRSSTPSVDGKPRSKCGKVRGRSKEPTPPPTTPVPMEITPVPEVAPSCETPIVQVKAEVVIPPEEDVPMEDTQPIEPIEEDFVDVSPPKIIKEPVLQLSDISFNKKMILSNPKNAVVIIPECLQSWLADDWYHITRLKRLVNLPAQPSVCDILLDYRNYKISLNPDVNTEELLKVTNDIEEYFNICLGAFLLFKCERPQYADLLEAHPGVLPSRIFGAHHFLRLFMKTAMLLSSIPNSAVSSILLTLHDMLNFLAAKESDYFCTSNFGIAPPEYHRRNI